MYPKGKNKKASRNAFLDIYQAAAFGLGPTLFKTNRDMATAPKQISTTITINAPADVVWKVLTDFGQYPNWNPFIKSIEGNPAEGKTITTRIEPPGAKGMVFKPVVLAYQPNKEFRWKGKLFIKGLFDGEHVFELTANANGTTSLVQREVFTGILVPLFAKMLDINTLNGFRQMNEALKTRAESMVNATVG